MKKINKLKDITCDCSIDPPRKGMLQTSCILHESEGKIAQIPGVNETNEPN